MNDKKLIDIYSYEYGITRKGDNNMMYSINEIDVWKDETGYFINDVFKTGIKIDIDPDNTRQVFKEIRRFYSLPNGKYTTNIKESGEGNLFEIVDRHTYEPILQLEKI